MSGETSKLWRCHLWGFGSSVFGIKPGSKSPVNVRTEVTGVCLGNSVEKIVPLI